MAYATVQDLHDQRIGLQSNIALLEELLEEASDLIDVMTCQHFEPREQTRRLDGSGTRALSVPVPLLEVQQVFFDDVPQTPPQSVVRPTAPVLVGDKPHTLVSYGPEVWPKGLQNVEITGLWGFTEVDSNNPVGRTPRAIRRATILIVAKILVAPIGDPYQSGTLEQDARITEVRTREQTIKYAHTLKQTSAHNGSCGIMEVDRLLVHYKSPNAPVPGTSRAPTQGHDPGTGAPAPVTTLGFGAV